MFPHDTMATRFHSLVNVVVIVGRQGVESRSRILSATQCSMRAWRLSASRESILKTCLRHIAGSRNR
jgi:hypothetical protein